MKTLITIIASVLLLGSVGGPTRVAAADERNGVSESAVMALHQVRQDVEVGLVELAALRTAIAKERQPLADRVMALEGYIEALDTQSSGLIAREQLRQERRTELERTVGGLEDQVAFIRAALSEYRRSVPTRLSVAEADAWADALADLDQLERSSGSTNLAALAGYWMACLDQSAAATEAALHGFSRAATAVAADGRAVDGKLAMVGPVGWFVSADGEVHGILAAREGSTRAGVVSVPDSEAMGELVKQLAAGKRVLLPLDVTEGRAALLQADQRGLYDELVTGGVVMIPLVLVALLAMVVAVLKTVSLWRVHGVDAHAAVAIAQSYAAGDTAAAERSSAALPAPLRAVVNEGLAHYDAAPVILEEIVEERVMSQLPGLERHLWLLAVLAGIAPLLGLLGTVTGMIHTFQLVTVFGTGDAGLLSGGISEALVTTKFGLVIAIPVLVVHALLSRRVRTLMAELEQAATAFVHALISARTAGSSDGGAVS
jgi:biopolymer transport protein ExbB